MPIGARHVCLLFKRLQSFGSDVTRPYVRALEARRLPHVLVGGKSFHEREEVIALRSALGGDRVARRRAERLRDAARPVLRARGRRRSSRSATRSATCIRCGKRDDAKLTELTRPVGEALDVLARLHVGRNRRPIADTIARFLEATRAHAGVAIWPAGEQALANVLRVLDMARRFEQAR